MKKVLSICFVLMIIITASSVTAGKNPVKHKTAGRVIKPQKLFRGSVVVSETFRIVTAYNAGDPTQNHGNPCIAASGENLCKALSTGKKRCAANFVPLGTKLYIEKYGIFEVTDRTNRRYRNRVDIAMRLGEIHKAKQFGRQKLNVKILGSRKVYPPKQPTRLAKVTQPIR